MGAVNLGALTVLTLVLVISLTILTSADTAQYFVGEKIKIDLGDADEYIISIKTPNQTFIQKSTKSYFIYQPTNPGKYQIHECTREKTRD